MMLLSRIIFRKFGWGVAALITPTVLLITGVAFFGLILFGGVVDPILAKMALTPLFAAVLVGAAQNIFSKSAKYSLFDPCKEMAYIPLDQETQLKASHLLSAPHQEASGISSIKLASVIASPRSTQLFTLISKHAAVLGGLIFFSCSRWCCQVI